MYQLWYIGCLICGSGSTLGMLTSIKLLQRTWERANSPTKMGQAAVPKFKVIFNGTSVRGVPPWTYIPRELYLKRVPPSSFSVSKCYISFGTAMIMVFVKGIMAHMILAPSVAYKVHARFFVVVGPLKSGRNAYKYSTVRKGKPFLSSGNVTYRMSTCCRAWWAFTQNFLHGFKINHHYILSRNENRSAYRLLI